MQLLKTNQYKRLLLTGCCLSLSLLSARTFVYAQSSSNSSSSNSSPSPAELPVLLLIVQRPAGTSPHREDANTALSTMLRATLRESRKYQVILYSADQPSIRRALLEHSIAASELAEPIKPAAMQKLAALLGARHILMVSSLLDKVGMKTDIRLMQDMGLDTWVTPRSEPVSVDAQFGKLKLKPDQMAALTVDNIDGYLGIPSHLAANIHLSKTRIIGKAIEPKDAKDKAVVAGNSKDNGSQASNNKDPKEDSKDENSKDSSAPNSKVAANGKIDGTHNTDGLGQADGTTGAQSDPKTAVKTSGDTDNPGGTGTTASSGVPVKPLPRPKTPSKSARSVQTAKNDKNTKAAVASQANPQETNPQESNGNQSGNFKTDSHEPTPRKGGATPPTILTTDAGAFLLSEPKIVPPVPPLDKINHEALADRYRHVGDLPNSIEALRQAIDQNPRDMRLRKKLVVAYQDRQLFEQAISETERAMQMEPNDADLSSLYAKCLAAKGDTTGATRLLQNIVIANPKNTGAQVALGDALLADNQYADAYRAFEAAAENDPKSPLPHRRLARVMAARAGSDSKQYAGCLQQIDEARRLTPPTDTLTYQSDYFALMLLMESRLKDTLDQVNETYIGVGKRPQNELQRLASDLNLSAESASDFIDKLQPAVGQDTTHAHFAQGAAFLVSAVGYLRKYVKSYDPQIGSSLRGTRLDALNAFATAHTRLIASRAALEKGRAAIGETAGGG